MPEDTDTLLKLARFGAWALLTHHGNGGIPLPAAGLALAATRHHLAVQDATGALTLTPAAEATAPALVPADDCHP